MTVERLLEELAKLPPQARLVNVQLTMLDEDGYAQECGLADVRWQGNVVSLEGE